MNKILIIRLVLLYLLEMKTIYVFHSHPKTDKSYCLSRSCKLAMQGRRESNRLYLRMKGSGSYAKCFHTL